MRIQPIRLKVGLLSIFLAVLTMSPVGVPIKPGLDPSYQFAFNYFFINGTQIGKDILFTFGPFGFLLWPQPQGNNLLFALLTILILKIIFIFIIFNLYSLIKGRMTIKNWVLVITVSYIFSSIVSVHNLFVFIPLLLILTYLINNNFIWIMTASIVVAIALLVKASAGIISLFFLISFSTYSVWVKDYKAPLFIFFTTVSTFLLIWFLLYQNFYGIYNYLHATLEFSKGNSSAMTRNPDNNWLIFSLFLVSFFSFPLIKKEKILTLLYIISFLSIAAFFKYAISREDHIFGFETFLLEFIFVIFIVTKNKEIKDFLFLSTIYILFLSFIYMTPYKGRIQQNILNHISKLSIESIKALDNENNFRKLQQKSISNIKPYKLDNDSQKLISNSTVDVYPWDTSYIPANSFIWRPRPVFQSYITYTSFLDEQNAKFFKSKNAPKFIIWQLKHWGGEVGSIDGRYLFNDEPLTIYEILNNYSVVRHKDAYLILKRGKSRLTSTIILEKYYQWGQWIEVPKTTGRIGSSFLQAKTYFQRSLLQKVKKLVYKEFEVYIHYRFSNGKEKRYRIVVDTAKDGLWITPLLDSLFNFDFGKNVVAIKFTHNKYDFFEDNFLIQWNMVTSKNSLSGINNSDFAKAVNIKVGEEDGAVNFHIDEY